MEKQQKLKKTQSKSFTFEVYESNYALEKHCLRSKNKMHLQIGNSSLTQDYIVPHLKDLLVV